VNGGGCAHEGIAPKVAVLLLTPRCNMACDFCGADAGFDPLPQGEAEALASRLAREGVQSIVLGGGEPFLWRQDLLRLARHIRDLGLVVQIGSNGTLVPSDNAVLTEFDRWILPIESVEASVHDLMRPHQGGHLSQVLRLLERLRVEGVEATVSSLITQENLAGLGELGSLLRWFQQNGGRLHAWHLYRFMSVGRGGAQHAARFATAEGAFEAAGAVMKSRFRDLQVYLRPDLYHSKETSFYWWKRGRLMCHAALGGGGQQPQPWA
jgi:MoaA/NifB/PqqE/SkfB family radical SAM enzyme